MRTFVPFIMIHFSSLVLLSVSPTHVSLQVTLGQWLKHTMLFLCSNFILSFTGNYVKSFVLWYVMYVFRFDGMLFLSCLFILDNNWMSCFPENGRNCSFVSPLSVLLVFGSLVILTFSFSSLFLIMLSTILD